MVIRSNHSSVTIRIPSQYHALLLGAIALLAASCLDNSKKCGDDMVKVSGKDFNMGALCIPKEDSDSGSDTSEIDAGADAAVEEIEECESSKDCKGKDFCDLTLSPPACRAPATGQGESCEKASDCAGYGADFCESYVSFTCLVQNCSPEHNNCSSEYICCDFSWFDPPLPPLCVSRELSGDECYVP